MQVHQSSEDYLETILMLRQEKGSVRSIDIVNKLNFSKPSVSVAMRNLRQNGHITMDESGYISLTPSGEAIASSILEKHKFITELLIRIGVPAERAQDEACRLEHNISQDTFEKVRSWVELHK
ncbi:MAG: metal-dependent transcriptional regulator [Lachnospiraceae bacterium]|nr:metal-dependent transcriptional regulator [Lachnospiraceae bacterium]